MVEPLPLQEMTLREKIIAMEMLWEDLARSTESVQSPSWHQTILEERTRRIEEGNSRFLDWESAKKAIRDETS